MRTMTTSRLTHTIGVLLVALTLAAAAAGTAGAQPSDSGLARLEREITRLSPLAEGTVGFAALHLETGRSVVLGRGTGFPMASVRKLPIALRLLALVDEGKERPTAGLAQPTDSVQEARCRCCSMTLGSPPLHNLLELMLSSVTTRPPTSLRAAGGLAVTDHVKRPARWHLRRSLILQSQADIAASPAERADHAARSRSCRRQWRAWRSAEARGRLARYGHAEGMATLLARPWRGELLSPKSTALLPTSCGVSRPGGRGSRRPPRARSYHKTGSVARTTNDVGVIAMPAGGHVAIAAFVKEGRGGK
jgi:beta-lactamase class A